MREKQKGFQRQPWFSKLLSQQALIKQGRKHWAKGRAMLQLQNNTYRTSDSTCTSKLSEFQTKTAFFIFSETVVMRALSFYHNAVVLHKGYYPLSPEPKRNHFSTKHNSGKNSTSKPHLGKEGTALNFEAVLESVLFPLLLLRWIGQKQAPVVPHSTSIIKDTQGQG